MGLFGSSIPKAPITDEARMWLHARMKWLGQQFGMDTWRNIPAIEPTQEFFPDKFDGTKETVRPMFDRICGYMQIDPARVDLQFYSERPHANSQPGQLFVSTVGGGAAGLYYNQPEKQTIALETAYANDPMTLAATIAHELSHVRLLGEGRLNREIDKDHEAVTDLTTVFFGMGIFTANSCVRFDQYTSGGWFGWRAGKLGYLNEETFGYALGLWTFVRGDGKPKWMKHLRPNPRAFMKQTIQFLKADPPAEF